MNPYLKNIEQNTAEHLWLAGESLYETEGLFVKTSKVSKTLWNIILNDGKEYEVEILLRSNKPKFTCECEGFYKEASCKHIIASLIYIKEDISKKELQKQKIKAREKKRKASEAKYNVKSILESAHPEELKRFVRAYANMENSFSLALKGHFANKMDLDNNDQKYKQLLDSAVKPKNFKHMSLSTTEKKDFYRLVDSLSSQAEDCVTLKQYRECKYILVHLLDKISYIRKNYNHNPVRLETKEIVVLDLLKDLLKEKMPPELQQEIYGNLVELLNRSYYVPADRNILETSMKLIDYKEEDLQEIADKIIPLINEKDELSQFFMVFYFYLFQQNSAVLDKLLDKVRLDTITIGLQHLYKLKKIPLLIGVLKSLQERKQESKAINILACKALFEAGLISDGLTYLKDILEVDKDAGLAIGLVNFIPEQSQETHLKELNEIFESSELTNLLKYYKNTDQHEQIAKVLEDNSDLPLLWEYDHVIFDLDEDLFYKIYLKTTINHLNNYAGSAGKEAILTSLNRFNLYGQKKMRGKLQDALKEEFSHRKIIKEISKH